MGRVLVTGGSGFIGSHLLKLLDNPVCVVREQEFHAFDSVFSVSSIDENTDWSGAFVGIESIIHLAGLAHSKEALSMSDYRSINTFGTLNLARMAAQSGVKRFVFVSTIGVNGQCTHGVPFLPHQTPDPHNLYALSKYEAEVGLKKISSETGLEVVIVRPTLVYGAGAPGNFGALVRLINKLPILPFGFADNKRDFISVSNLADLLLTCTFHPRAAGHTFLASDFETVSIKDFTNAISDAFGKKIVQLPVPVGLMKFFGRVTRKSGVIEQLYGDLQVDSSNLKEVLGWSPPLTMNQAMSELRHTSTL